MMRRWEIPAAVVLLTAVAVYPYLLTRKSFAAASAPQRWHRVYRGGRR